jgi:hypothetical protein
MADFDVSGVDPVVYAIRKLVVRVVSFEYGKWM